MWSPTSGAELRILMIRNVNMEIYIHCKCQIGLKPMSLSNQEQELLSFPFMNYLKALFKTQHTTKDQF